MPWAREFSIGSSTIGPGHPPYVIAEIGSNHDGKLDQALRLIESASQCGANAVKFQLFAAYGLVAKQVRSDAGRLVANPVHALVEKLELPLDWLPKLWTEAQGLGIELMITPFGVERLVAWVEMGARAVKIASGDLTHTPLLRAASASGLPILLGCGMSSEQEVAEALATIEEAKGAQVALMHCVSRYPAEDADLNLRAIPALAQRFGLPVGFSDTAGGTTAAIAAAALGASVIEKHLTIDSKLPGPDHAHSLDPPEFSQMVRQISRAYRMLGDGVKRPMKSEIPEQKQGRRSVVATGAIKAGKVLLREHLKAVRPGGGIPPEKIKELIGKKLKRNVHEDEMIFFEDVE